MIYGLHNDLHNRTRYSKIQVASSGFSITIPKLSINESTGMTTHSFSEREVFLTLKNATFHLTPLQEHGLVDEGLGKIREQVFESIFELWLEKLGAIIRFILKKDHLHEAGGPHRNVSKIISTFIAFKSLEISYKTSYNILVIFTFLLVG